MADHSYDEGLDFEDGGSWEDLLGHKIGDEPDVFMDRGFAGKNGERELQRLDKQLIPAPCGFLRPRLAEGLSGLAIAVLMTSSP